MSCLSHNVMSLHVSIRSLYFDIKLGCAYNRHVLVIKFMAMKAYYSFLPI